MIMRRTTPRRLKATGFPAVLCLAALLAPPLPARAQKPAAQPAPTGREGSDQREQSDPAVAAVIIEQGGQTMRAKRVK